MSVSVTYNGNTYAIPEDEETGWESLTDFLVALALNSATTTAMNFAARTAATTPQTLQASDSVLAMNVPSASVANLPTGTAKQFYGVYDVSGAANTNPITVTPSGGQLIAGEATYVIRSNYGGVWLQFDGTEWIVLAEVGNVFKAARRIENNATNTAFVEGSITANGTFSTSANLTSCSASFAGSNSIEILVSLSTGESVLLHASFLGAQVSALSDPSGIFLATDAGTGIFVSKAGSSSTVSFKNRTGVSLQIEIKSLSTRIASATAWA